MSIKFLRCTASDADALADLRVAAMRPSLEAVGRFDPERARNRFLEGFSPDATCKIERDGVLIGFFVMKDFEDHIFLDHLYVSPTEQGHGVGGEVIAHVKARASERSVPVRLCALNKSKVNGFYVQQGFSVTRVEELDRYYEYVPQV